MIHWMLDVVLLMATLRFWRFSIAWKKMAMDLIKLQAKSSQQLDEMLELLRSIRKL